jgi:biopolymer transport protein ExbB/TolQ
MELFILIVMTVMLLLNFIAIIKFSKFFAEFREENNKRKNMLVEIQNQNKKIMEYILESQIEIKL